MVDGRPVLTTREDCREYRDVGDVHGRGRKSRKERGRVYIRGRPWDLYCEEEGGERDAFRARALLATPARASPRSPFSQSAMRISGVLRPAQSGHLARQAPDAPAKPKILFASVSSAPRAHPSLLPASIHARSPCSSSCGFLSPPPFALTASAFRTPWPPRPPLGRNAMSRLLKK